MVRVVLHGRGGDAAVGTDRRLFSLCKGQILGWPYREVRDLRVVGSALRFKAPVPLHAIFWAPCAVNLAFRRQDWEDDWARLQIAWRDGVSTSTGHVKRKTADRLSLNGEVMAAEGFGLLQPSAPCRLEFDADGVAVRTVGDTGYVLAASIPFADMLTLRVGGPGAVASNMGPGWLDGGIGSEQEIPDGLHATALDNLTTPVGPESILQLGARGLELLLLLFELPADLQERLGPVMDRLRADEGSPTVHRLREPERVASNNSS